MRKSAAAAPAALEERELFAEGGEGGQRRSEGRIFLDDVAIRVFDIHFFRDRHRGKRGEDGAARGPRAEPDPRSTHRVDVEPNRGSSSVLTADRDARGARRTEVGPGKRNPIPLARGSRLRNFPEI